MTTNSPVVPRVGVSLPVGPMNGPLGLGTLADAARRIEAAGFSAAWTGDAVGRGFFVADPLITISAAAAATERIDVGTAILQVPLQSSLGLARRILSAWLVCGDRLVLGLGTGSTLADFESYGLDYEGRFKAFREGLREMRQLWNNEPVGPGHLDVAPPLLGGPPVLIGSWGGNWVEHAAREFGGWIASGTRKWSEVEPACARFREAGGSRALISTVMCDLTAEAGPPAPDDAINLRCPPDEARRRLERLASFGFTDIALITADHSEEGLRAVAALGQA
jgi:alkanesulfonate monooxygenase SsuD/methylene tetrahydromethanopterin reductase-like flavin-dependent oxidoreductase (luciferase family)